MSSFERDYSFGKEQESEILGHICNYFKRNIAKSDDRYSAYDFSDGAFTYELKSRNNDRDAFPTTLIQKYKCKLNTILLFNYLDGLYYIEYKPNEFNKFLTKKFKRNDRIDKVDLEYECYYIPVNKLKCICKYESELDF